ncbi:DUF6843 domain-containing protein [Hymenobacter arizonensis]|uniref:DUF6843 domain-containing protein n=1 Tax=Hymenobacter arizonensis TaxID=1227077 RepID=A0A1I6BP36_HYMAR|nr:hypothetical protein [Hymenobacter arizonensis]SFQ82671.1 hypothetical protein SAMN04515668_4862 [Hymenobacter arizonensis]
MSPRDTSWLTTPPRDTSWRRLGFWVGPLLLLGSLLLAVPIFMIGAYLPPLLLLLLLPAGGLLLGVWLIVRGPQPRWAKLLALSPVLGPVLIVLLVTGAKWLPPHNRLVFLIPEGFRGRVILSRQYDMPDPFTEVDGRAILHVPPYGHLSTSDPLGADDLARAEYYLVDATGQRLRQLHPLDELAFAKNQQRTGPGGVLDPQQVGVFTAGHRHKRPYQPTPFTTNYPSEISYSPDNEVNGLQFTVSCYDSLAVLLRRPDF